MSRHAARARSGKDRTSLYQEITDNIIAELEAGRVPWVQPWGTVAAKASLTMPKNAATHRHLGSSAHPVGRSHRLGIQHPELAHFPPGPASAAVFVRVSVARQFSMLTTLCPMRNVGELCAMEANPWWRKQRR